MKKSPIFNAIASTIISISSAQANHYTPELTFEPKSTIFASEKTFQEISQEITEKNIQELSRLLENLEKTAFQVTIKTEKEETLYYFTKTEEDQIKAGSESNTLNIGFIDKDANGVPEEVFSDKKISQKNSPTLIYQRIIFKIKKALLPEEIDFNTKPELSMFPQFDEAVQ